MNEELTIKAVRPIELPPPLDPPPDQDRLAIAVVAEIVERGYEQATLEGVLRRARASRSEFDRRFGSLDDCALDSFERFIADFERRVGGAFNAQAHWPSALRAAAYATSDWMAENPEVSVFGMVEVLKMPGELVKIRREETFDFCSRMIDRGREAAEDPGAIPDSAPTFAIGAITQLLTHRLQEEAEIDPPAVIPEMMARVVGIYLGDEAAEAEWTATRPPAEQPRGRR